MTTPDISHLSLPQSYSYVPSAIEHEPANQHSSKTSSKQSWQLFAKPSIPVKSGHCPLLALPLEIRQQILELVLPYTVPHVPEVKQTLVYWRPGCTAVLAASRQLHEEGAKLMYGNADFLIDVYFNGILFVFLRILKNNLRPKRTPVFEHQISRRYWPFIRRISACVVVEDDYTAEIKYGWGGPGLVDGVRKQVLLLVDMLRVSTGLRFLRVALRSPETVAKSRRIDQEVLEPFSSLQGVERSVWEGPIDPQLVEKLSRSVSEEMVEP